MVIEGDNSGTIPNIVMTLGIRVSSTELKGPMISTHNLLDFS
jgi:hypothetical protein